MKKIENCIISKNDREEILSNKDTSFHFKNSSLRLVYDWNRRVIVQENGILLNSELLNIKSSKSLINGGNSNIIESCNSMMIHHKSNNLYIQTKCILLNNNSSILKFKPHSESIIVGNNNEFSDIHCYEYQSMYNARFDTLFHINVFKESNNPILDI